MFHFNKRPLTAALLLTSAIMAPATIGCGSKSATNTDGGADAPIDTASDTGIGSFACDPGLQNCASASDECDFACQGGAAVVACRPDNGTASIGAPCSMTMPCAKGLGCIGMPADGVVCRKYCTSDTDCATGQRCHNDSVGVNCGTPQTTLLLHTCY